jgi:hypothetical protein
VSAAGSFIAMHAAELLLAFLSMQRAVVVNRQQLCSSACMNERSIIDDNTACARGVIGSLRYHKNPDTIAATHSLLRKIVYVCIPTVCAPHKHTNSLVDKPASAKHAFSLEIGAVSLGRRPEGSSEAASILPTLIAMSGPLHTLTL